MVERQIGTIKNSLVKVLEDNPEMWSQIIEGILFAHRVSRHSSTKYSPFMLMYNRQSVLSTDVKHNWTKMKAKNEKTEKEMEMKRTIRSRIFWCHLFISNESPKNIRG